MDIDTTEKGKQRPNPALPDVKYDASTAATSRDSWYYFQLSILIPCRKQLPRPSILFLTELPRGAPLLAIKVEDTAQFLQLILTANDILMVAMKWFVGIAVIIIQRGIAI